MKNFDDILQRKNTNSIKWDFITNMYPNLKHEVLPLWVADMDFACSNEILNELHKRIDTQIFGYSMFDEEYYNIVINWFKTQYNYIINKENIFFSPGVVPALGALIRTLTNEGDGILIQPPVYYPFKNMIVNNKRTLIENSLIKDENNYYTIDFADLEKKLSLLETKMMILCSPHNPVGRVWKKEELEKIVELCVKYDVYLISDEIHCDLVRENVKFYSLGLFQDKIKEKLIICTAPSKSFNLAGLQLSNIIIFDENIKRLWNKEISERLAIGLPSPFAISATKAAYSKGQEWLEEVKKYIDLNLEFIKEYLSKELPLVKYTIPEGTYLAWLDFTNYSFSDEEITNRMLNVGKVAFDEGKLFGELGEKYQRINVACPKDILKDALDRIKIALEK